MFESLQCFDELLCLLYVCILLLEEDCTVKVTYDHLNEMLVTDYTDGCVDGKLSCIVPLSSLSSCRSQVNFVLQNVHTKSECVHFL